MTHLTEAYHAALSGGGNPNSLSYNNFDVWHGVCFIPTASKFIRHKMQATVKGGRE